MQPLIFSLTGEQIRAARAYLRLEQNDLAKASGLSLITIKRLEATRGPIDAHLRTLNALCDAFRSRGISFDIGPNSGCGLRYAPVEAPAVPPPSLPT